MHGVILESEQEELLTILVEAARSLPREERQKFWYIETMGHAQGAITHPALPRDTRAPKGDIEILALQGLLLLTHGSRGTLTFDVTPDGFRYYEMLKKKQGESVERVEATMKQYLNAQYFKTTYPMAFTKWQEAEDVLWSSDSVSALTTIGHLCREAMQELTTELVNRFAPDPVDPNKSHTVSRLRSVISKTSTDRSDAEKQLLDALVGYWGAVSDMVQRQEHGAIKEGSPLVWEDGRRVVFQTAMVMFEIARALSY